MPQLPPTFLRVRDAPNSYVGQAGKVVSVKTTEDGVEFTTGTPGSGTVSAFSSGALSPLFTTSVATATTTPALSFVLSNAAAHTYLGNNTGSTAAPAYHQIAYSEISGTPTIPVPGADPGYFQYNNAGAFGAVQGAGGYPYAYFGGTYVSLSGDPASPGSLAEYYPWMFEPIISDNFATGVLTKDDHVAAVHHALSLYSTETNTRTGLRITPNGTSNSNPTFLQFFGTDFNADPTNYEVISLFSHGSIDAFPGFILFSFASGSGTLRPITIEADGLLTTPQLVIGTDGGVSIGTNTAAGSTNLKVAGTITGSNLSGTNTGNQTSIVGISGTLSEFNTALTGADFASGGGTATGANTGDQTITLTGDVTGSGTGSFTATVDAAAKAINKVYTSNLTLPANSCIVMDGSIQMNAGVALTIPSTSSVLIHAPSSTPVTTTTVVQTGADRTYSNVTIAPVQDLSFPASANSLYEVSIMIAGQATGTAGVLIQLNCSGTSQTGAYEFIGTASGTASGTTANTINGNNNSGFWTTATTDLIIFGTGYVKTTGVGVISIQMLKNTSGTFTIYKGSRMTVTKLA